MKRKILVGTMVSTFVLVLTACGANDTKNNDWMVDASEKVGEHEVGNVAQGEQAIAFYNVGEQIVFNMQHVLEDDKPN